VRRLDVSLNNEEARAFERVLKARKCDNLRTNAAGVIRELVLEEDTRIQQEKPKR
jgi:hypothetical protein